MNGRVAVIKTRPETVLEDTERVMKIAGFEDALDKGATTILKDNISWHYPMPGANTTPWQLEGVILALLNNGYRDLVAVENKTVVTRPEKGRYMNKYDRVYQKYDIPILLNFEDKDMKWIRYEPKAQMRVLNHIYPEGIHIPDYFFGKNIVQLPTMKCHIYTTTTGAMKNAFGGLLNTRRHYTHSWIHETLVDLLQIQYEIHSGLFAVMDGTTAGNGPGPRTLQPVNANYLLASADQVAIDAVAAKMMGFEPMSLPYIRIAHEEGLGIGKPEEITVVGEDISGVNLHFTVGDNLASMAGDVLWFGPLKRFQKLFFHTPLVGLFVWASDFYHDKVWWNTKGVKAYRQWLQESPWGRLFDRY
ncbi:MAG: DUF362 domain-containing protein [Syntrophomonadaceae bacterium]|jgi:uncharacterized protein (DUF362 family)|nr:DUF362 domain-containing protein [Syntrophomonadaceae bacterium]